MIRIGKARKIMNRNFNKAKRHIDRIFTSSIKKNARRMCSCAKIGRGEIGEFNIDSYTKPEVIDYVVKKYRKHGYTVTVEERWDYREGNKLHDYITSALKSMNRTNVSIDDLKKEFIENADVDENWDCIKIYW